MRPRNEFGVSLLVLNQVQDVNSLKLASLVDGLVEAAGELAVSLGLNRVVGQLYALLYFSSRPISLDEMTERLKMSKGNISLNIRELEKWEAVRKVWVKGSRKDHYQVEPDILKIVFNRLKIGLTRRMEQTVGAITKAEITLKEIEDQTNKKQKATIQPYRERLERLKGIHSTVKTLLEGVSLENFL